LLRVPLPFSTPLATAQLPSGAADPTRVGLRRAAVLERLSACGLLVGCLSGKRLFPLYHAR
jgi:hypothetical protein